jgi:hypothetical protein
MNKPLSLSDHQLRQIHAVAKALLPSQRSDFVHGVKRRLAITHPTKPCSLRSVPNWHSITSPPSCVQNNTDSAKFSALR